MRGYGTLYTTTISCLKYFCFVYPERNLLFVDTSRDIVVGNFILFICYIKKKMLKNYCRFLFELDTKKIKAKHVFSLSKSTDDFTQKLLSK